MKTGEIFLFFGKANYQTQMAYRVKHLQTWEPLNVVDQYPSVIFH